MTQVSRWESGRAKSRMAVDAGFDVRLPGHGDSDRDQPAAPVGDRGGDLQQVPGVAGAVAGAIDGRVVTGGLGELAEMTPQPPGERMEPVETPVQFGQKDHRPVAPLDVRPFMSDHRLQLGS